MLLKIVTLSASQVVWEANGFTFVASYAISVFHNASNNDSNDLSHQDTNYDFIESLKVKINSSLINTSLSFLQVDLRMEFL